jgi:hypothetical protein
MAVVKLYRCTTSSLNSLLNMYISRIHERTISFKFLGIILKVLRLEVSVYNVYITNYSFKKIFLKRGGVGLKSVVEVTVNNKEENSEYFCPNYVHEFGFSTYSLYVL